MKFCCICDHDNFIIYLKCVISWCSHDINERMEVYCGSEKHFGRSVGARPILYIHQYLETHMTGNAATRKHASI